VGIFKSKSDLPKFFQNLSRQKIHPVAKNSDWGENSRAKSKPASWRVKIQNSGKKFNPPSASANWRMTEADKIKPASALASAR